MWKIETGGDSYKPILASFKANIYTHRMYVPESVYIRWWYTIILNHPRGWGGKPIGSPGDSRVAEISRDFGNPAFFVPIPETAEVY